MFAHNCIMVFFGSDDGYFYLHVLDACYAAWPKLLLRFCCQTDALYITDLFTSAVESPNMTLILLGPQ